MRRVALLFPPARRAALRAAFRQLRDEVAARLVKARDAGEVFALLAELEPTSSALCSFIGSLFQDFDPGAVAQTTDQGVEEIRALRRSSHRRMKPATAAELDDALALYEASVRVLGTVDLGRAVLQTDTARTFTQAAADSDALLVTVAMVLDGELKTRSARGFAALVGALRDVCLARYSLARELASMASLDPGACVEERVERLHGGRRTFALRDVMHVAFVEGDGGVTAILHALDLSAAAPTRAEALVELGERFAALWDAVAEDHAAPVTLDAEALRWRLRRVIGDVEASV
ncbi:MAG: hypothetical protein HY909_03455 [Deltaproteobacteria bacterium]|nr:hypothetical protein [Deltaproteobacteria bacterium]